MRGTLTLPDGYAGLCSIDLQKDKRLALLINGLAGYAAYVVLHELVHGVCMKYFSGAPVRYGFTGLYAYARSEAYFTKKRYFIIALAPVAVWGVVLLALCMLVPAPWFWTVYLIQIGNIAGAAGDFYVVWRFAAMPPDILVRDAGVDMTVYSRGRKVQAQ